MNAICLVLDCLHTGFLGPYGNTWIHTPAFDLLASKAFTFDFAVADSPRLGPLYESYWHVKHALYPAPARASFPARLREAGLTPALMTDEPLVAEHPLAGDFDQRIVIPVRRPSRPAGQLDETHFAACFAQIVDWLEQAPDGFFLWCHLGGLGTVWDAPLDDRRASMAPDDPEPFSGTEPPQRRLPADYDPDELFGIVQAYAGQVSLLDTCLGGLLSLLDRCPVFLAVAGARGFPLGEHLRVGPCELPLYGELVHVPVFLLSPDGLGASARSPALVQPADLSATLLDVLGMRQTPSYWGESLIPVVRGERPAVRQCALVVGLEGELAVRTPAWYLRRAASSELFVKPDDRWEANNVANRCVDVVEQLCGLLSRTAHASSVSETLLPPQLSGILLDGLQ